MMATTDDFATDEIWEEGLGFELDAALVGFRALRETVEIIAERLDESEDTERRGAILQELRAVMRRLDAVSDGRAAGGRSPRAAPVGHADDISEFARSTAKRCPVR